MFEQHLVPAGTRLIHVGPPKTGTTAVQSSFFRLAAEELHRHGVHYAGPGSRPKEAGFEITASPPREPMPHWEALAAEVRDAGDRRVCISNETFATGDDRAAQRMVRDLGGDTAHVALVVRPVERLLPSQWQQRVRKAKSMVSYEEWLRIVLGGEPDGRHYEHFWRIHDLPAHLERWSNAADPARVHAVVSREGDRDFLPRLFEGFLGLPEGLLVPMEDRSNASLSYTGAELLRRLDREVAQTGWSREYHAEMKAQISRFLRAQAKDPLDQPIELPAWAVDRVAELNDLRASALEQAAVDVIGDPGTLRTSATPTVRDPEAPEPRVSLAVASGVLTAGVDALDRRERRLRRRVRRLEAQLERERARHRRAAPSEETSTGDRLRATASRIARRARMRPGSAGQG